MPKQYTMTIMFNDSSEIAEAQFEPNPKKKGDILQFDAGDSIKVKYARSGNGASPKVISSILLAGPMQPELAQSPFDSGSSPIDLVAKPDLTIDNTVGVWGFSVAFTVQNQNSTSFYYLPDPEMEVGST